jgi:cytochrome bd-type quinol oxidase subunit 2
LSDRRHRAGGGGGASKALAWSGWGILTLLLAGNIAMGLINQKDEQPQGFITPEVLQAAGLWIPVLAAMTFAVLGLYWSTKAHKESERSSLLWARRGYAFSLVGAVIFLMAVFDAETFRREWLAVVAGLVLAVQSVLFAMFAYREFKRSAEGEGRRGRRPDEPSSKELLKEPSKDAAPRAETPRLSG